MDPEENVTFNVTTTIHPPSNLSDSVELGYICAAFSCILFGSNLVPVKKFETGDGLFFQWIACSGIFIIGLIVNVIRNFPPFYPLVMVGGAMWATGNVVVVPIIKTIGLGLGILIWATCNMLSGWASGRYGWFNTNPDIPQNLSYNYLGVSLAALSGLFYLSLKSEISNSHEHDLLLPITSEVSLPVDTNSDIFCNEEISPDNCLNIDSQDHRFSSNQNSTNGHAFWDNLSPFKRRIFGCTLAILAGFFFGLSFTPAIYCQSNYPGASQHGLDYVFAEICGIYATSTLYFTIYCAVKRNKPALYPKVVLPGLLSGALWAVAQSGWFIANSALGEAISFPIITTGPSIIGALWSILVFKEIQGLRNYLTLGLAFAVGITGAVFSAFSRA